MLLLMFCGCGAAATQEVSKPLVQTESAPLRQWKLSGEPSVVYVGKEPRYRDTRVEVVPLVAVAGSELSEYETKDWHLIRVNGGDEDINGTIFLAKWDSFAYMANIKGRPRNLLYLHRGREDTWRYEPERNKFRPLVPDEEAPEIGEELLQRYFEQVDSGKQEKLAPSSRTGRVRAQDVELESTRAKLQASCNISTLAIDWSTVKEGLISEYPIASNCASEVQSVLDFCESYPNVKTSLKSIAKVRCDFSRHTKPGARELVVDGNELVYYLTSKRAKDSGATPRTLRTSFGELDQVLEGAKSTLIFRYGGQRNTLYYEIDNRFYPIGYENSRTDRNFRVASGIRYAAIHTGSWHLDCGFDVEKLPLRRIVGEKRKQILANATFDKQALWKREPYFLARNTHGVYYYVDRYRQEFGGKHYRVFVGKRGMLKLSKLKGLVEDSEGTVFSTAQGKLRLIVSPQASALWIRGNKRTELTTVDTDENRRLIFDELGVYLGENLGHICDE